MFGRAKDFICSVCVNLVGWGVYTYKDNSIKLKVFIVNNLVLKYNLPIRQVLSIIPFHLRISHGGFLFFYTYF